MMEPEKSYQQRGVDYQVPAEMLTLPGRYYHAEEIYREEMEKIFFKRWLIACREEEIKNPGDFVTVPVGEESLILVRDKDGSLHAHFNVCRHRGTRICAQEQGHFEGGRITCPYHAWQYDLSGRLEAAPLMKEVAGFDRANFPLHAASLKTWGGFVFVNLAQQPVSFESEMGPLLGKFKEWHLAELRIAHKIEYHLNCNWKIILQNYQECYHCPGVHPLLSEWTPFRGAVHDCMEGAVIGGYMEMTKPRGSMTMDGDAAAPPVCEVSGPNLQRVHYYSIFPNMLLSPHPDFVLYHRIRSLAVDRILTDCYFLLHPETIGNPKLMERFHSAIEFWDLTNRQDWQVCEQMQQGLRSQRFTRGRYSGQEDILYAIDREVLKSLGHSEPSQE